MVLGQSRLSSLARERSERIWPSVWHRGQYGGEPGKPGSTYGWAGNDQVGEGRMTLLDAEAPSRVSFRLEFLKPYQSVATTAFRLSPGSSGTKVTWEIEGRLGYLEKLVGLFMDMTGMIGADFDRGLGALKAVAERPEPPPDVPATAPSKG